MTPPAANRRRDNSVFSGCLGAVLKGGCAVAVVAALGLAFLYWQVSSSLNRSVPKEAVAPVAWTTVNLPLSANRPVAHGTLVLHVRGGDNNSFEGGVNVGVPTSGATAADAAPASLLQGPVVRLAVTSSEGARQGDCLAACELALATPTCASDCTLSYDVTVTLVGAADGSGQVTVHVAGGASASMGGRAPEVQFSMDGASPLSSGGS